MIPPNDRVLVPVQCDHWTWTIPSFDILWSKWPLGLPGADTPSPRYYCALSSESRRSTSHCSTSDHCPLPGADPPLLPRRLQPGGGAPGGPGGPQHPRGGAGRGGQLMRLHLRHPQSRWGTNIFAVYREILPVCSGGGAGGQRRGGAGVRGRRAPRPAPRAGCAHPRLRHPRLQRVQGALLYDVTCLSSDSSQLDLHSLEREIKRNLSQRH